MQTNQQNAFDGLKAQRLNKAYKKLSKDINDCSAALIDAGLEYFYLPCMHRAAWSNRTRQFFAKFFLVAYEGYQDPEVHQNLRYLRQLKDETRSALRQGKLTAADDKLMVADSIVDTVKDELEKLGTRLFYVVSRFKKKREEGWITEPLIADTGIPTADDGSLPSKYYELRAWALALPEMKAAVESGLITKDEAFQMVIAKEDRVIDDNNDDDDDDDFDTPAALPNDHQESDWTVYHGTDLWAPMDEVEGGGERGADDVVEQTDVRDTSVLQGAWQFR